jgi:hypothetical protein
VTLHTVTLHTVTVHTVTLHTVTLHTVTVHTVTLHTVTVHTVTVTPLGTHLSRFRLNMYFLIFVFALVTALTVFLSRKQCKWKQKTLH